MSRALRGDAVSGADDACVAFLQWALPRLGKRWPGYRKVRRQVCRRARRRAAELGLDDLAGYRAHLEPRFRRAVTVTRHDLRDPAPGGPFDLVLCRNVAFTYFDTDGQRAVLARLAGAMPAGAALVVGAHERLPDGAPCFAP